MKKLLALLLAGILCFSLSACGNDKYDSLIELLEAGDYESAIAYIKGLQTSNGTLDLGGVLVQVDPDATSPLTAEVQAILDRVPGKWVCTTENEKAPKEFIFQADGTCTVDGKALTWKRNGSTVHSFSGTSEICLSVYENDIERYDLTFYSGNGNELVFEYSVKDGFSVLSRIRYIDPDAYDIVELTTDNWQTYFDWTEAFYHNTNAFGEVTTLGTRYYFALKDTYFDRLSAFSISSGDVQITSISLEYYVTVSADGKSYVKSDRIYRDGSEYTAIHKLQKDSILSTGSYFGTQYTSASVHEDSPYPPSAQICSFVTNTSVDRIQGTLYLVKK